MLIVFYVEGIYRRFLLQRRYLYESIWLRWVKSRPLWTVNSSVEWESIVFGPYSSHHTRSLASNHGLRLYFYEVARCLVGLSLTIDRGYSLAQFVLIWPYSRPLMREYPSLIVWVYIQLTPPLANGSICLPIPKIEQVDWGNSWLFITTHIHQLTLIGEVDLTLHLWHKVLLLVAAIRSCTLREQTPELIPCVPCRRYESFISISQVSVELLIALIAIKLLLLFSMQFLKKQLLSLMRQASTLETFFHARLHRVSSRSTEVQIAQSVVRWRQILLRSFQETSLSLKILSFSIPVLAFLYGSSPVSLEMIVPILDLDHLYSLLECLLATVWLYWAFGSLWRIVTLFYLVFNYFYSLTVTLQNTLKSFLELLICMK